MSAMGDEKMNKELKPCPFCGGTDQRVKSSGRWGWFVSCRCCAVGPSTASREEAVEAWNKRHDERGKCSMYYGEDDYGIDSFWCSECGCRQAATFEHTEAGNLIERHIIEPRYCPFCGREVSE